MQEGRRRDRDQPENNEFGKSRPCLCDESVDGRGEKSGPVDGKTQNSILRLDSSEHGAFHVSLVPLTCNERSASREAANEVSITVHHTAIALC